MLQVRSKLDVADNTGAKLANMIAIVGYSKKRYARVGDIVSASVRRVIPGAPLKKGEVVKGVIIRTKSVLRREDGSYVRFDTNAIVLIDAEGNPKGTRVFGPVPRELRGKFMKIVSLAPEVV
jgi:large subunit ribosomal protein L14